MSLPRLLQLLALLPSLVLAWPAAAQALLPDPQQVAPGVYVIPGEGESIAPANGGRIGNCGFLVGESGVVVVDTGPSWRHGEALLQAIARVTDRPVKLAIITHAQPEFLFGAGALQAHGIPLLTHRRSAVLMGERCAHCLENLNLVLGEAAMAGTRLVIPRWQVEASQVLQVAGLELQLVYGGWAGTPGDLAVWHPASGVLFAAGTATVRTVPELRDGRLPDWLRALDGLRGLAPRVVVGSHGPPGTAADLDATAAYLRDLDALARRLYGEGTSLLEALDASDLPAYAGWARYGVLQRQNLQQRYLQLEAEELAR